MPSTNGTSVPTYHSTWARPATRPARRVGALSVISVHEAGTSAPTVSPTTK